MPRPPGTSSTTSPRGAATRSSAASASTGKRRTSSSCPPGTARARQPLGHRRRLSVLLQRPADDAGAGAVPRGRVRRERRPPARRAGGRRAGGRYGGLSVDSYPTTPMHPVSAFAGGSRPPSRPRRTMRVALVALALSWLAATACAPTPATPASGRRTRARPGMLPTVDARGGRRRVPRAQRVHVARRPAAEPAGEGQARWLGDRRRGAFYIAMERGYFAEEGLDVEFILFRRGADMIPPAGDRRAHIGGLGPGATSTGSRRARASTPAT